MDDVGSPLFDSLDVDLVIKVLSNTVFSPFFIFWIPMFYRSQGAPWDAPTVTASLAYFVFLCCFWTLKSLSGLWRNGLSSLKPRRFDWGEQIVLVTGGASGIGLLLARTLAVRNVTVVVLDVNSVDTENYNIHYYKCDVSKWEEVEAVSKKITEEVGHPTILINNAGVVQGKLILDLSAADVNQTFGTNVLSHFWILKAFLPQMIKEKAGHVVTVSSVLGLVGVAQMTDYTASKAAVVKLHESLRYELDKRYHVPEIRTTLLLPGHVSTPLFSRMSLPSASWYKFFIPSLPPHSVAKAVIAALDSQQSGTILMPFYTHFVPWLGILPSYARDLFQWFSMADYAMMGFIKVSGRRAEEGEAPLPASDSSKVE
ncbi:retinal short-chain dehydrogenase/reductase [Hysterangium stoloniferum]|nr:retinal short-chain dehydrogenase/reductase [Hysterangium stoloniferum]